MATSYPPPAPPPPLPSSSRSRRVVAGLVRFGLVVVALVFVGVYIQHHFFRSRRAHVQTISTTVVPDEALGPGDVRVYNQDSSVDVVLQGDRIMAGLSQKTVAKVRDEIAKSTSKDSGTTFGVNIGQIVKNSVAGAIGTHVVYRIADIRDISYDDGRLEIEWEHGGHHDLFGSTRVDHENVSDTFSREEAQRLIDAFHARKGK
jgi:hypothetical protein